MCAAVQKSTEKSHTFCKMNSTAGEDTAVVRFNGVDDELQTAD